MEDKQMWRDAMVGERVLWETAETWWEVGEIRNCQAELRIMGKRVLWERLAVVEERHCGRENCGR